MSKIDKKILYIFIVTIFMYYLFNNLILFFILENELYNYDKTSMSCIHFYRYHVFDITNYLITIL